LDCNRAISCAVSRNRWNNSRPSYRYCSPVVVVQLTRLFVPISRAVIRLRLMGNQKSQSSDDALVIGQWSVPCIGRNSHGLGNSEDAISLIVP
jgi:hypothetical protein